VTCFVVTVGRRKMALGYVAWRCARRYVARKCRCG
jgi:hypothetical protein